MKWKPITTRKTISPESAKLFADATRDPNPLHQNGYMMKNHGVPAVIPGMQLITTGLATADLDKLLSVNHLKAEFSKATLVGDEVRFDLNQPEGVLKLSVKVGRNKCAGSLANRLKRGKGISFYEGDISLKVKPLDEDLQTFKKITGLPDQAVQPLYAVALSSAAIASSVNSPRTPSFDRLNAGVNRSGLTRLVPTYDSMEIFFPGGMRDYCPEGLTFRSAISGLGRDYTIDTICYSGDSQLYGIRSNLRQSTLGPIIHKIRDLATQRGHLTMDDHGSEAIALTEADQHGSDTA